MKHLLAAGILLGTLAASAQEPASVPSPDRTPTPAPAPRTAAPAPETGTAAPIGTGGGSLADIAKKQKEKREKQGKRPSLGVISNQSLKKDTEADAAAKGGAKPKAKASPAATPAAVPISEVRDLNGRSEAEWRRIVAQARGRITGAEAKVSSLEAESKKLENDFYAWSDGNYRDRVIRPAWDQSREELGKARTELDEARARISELEDEARKSGAPPGWLR